MLCIFRRRRSLFSKAATTTTTFYFVLSTVTTIPVVRGFSSYYNSFWGYNNDNSMTTERSSDGTITVNPKNEAEQSALVVISHGLGDTAEGFVDVAEFLSKEMPYVKFILPTAPTRPVTMNMGMPMPSWYDITGLDERSNENCAGLEDSVQTLRNILQTEHENTKLPYNRMVLAGFSQGGALSLFTGYGLHTKLAGIVILSGYLAASKKFTCTPGLEDTPVLHCHGTQDPMVPYHLAEKTANKLKEHNVHVDTCYTLKSYPIQHTVSMDELSEVLLFLKKILPNDDPTYRITLKDPAEMSIKELKATIRKAGLSSKAVGLMEKSEFIKLVRDYRDGKL